MMAIINYTLIMLIHVNLVMIIVVSAMELIMINVTLVSREGLLGAIKLV
jgi:hypothetical protein